VKGTRRRHAHPPFGSVAALRPELKLMTLGRLVIRRQISLGNPKNTRGQS
jgi:hypothetical protein